MKLNYNRTWALFIVRQITNPWAVRRKEWGKTRPMLKDSSICDPYRRCSQRMWMWPLFKLRLSLIRGWLRMRHMILAIQVPPLDTSCRGIGYHGWKTSLSYSTSLSRHSCLRPNGAWTMGERMDWTLVETELSTVRRRRVERYDTQAWCLCHQRLRASWISFALAFFSSTGVSSRHGARIKRSDSSVAPYL